MKYLHILLLGIIGFGAHAANPAPDIEGALSAQRAKPGKMIKATRWGQGTVIAVTQGGMIEIQSGKSARLYALDDVVLPESSAQLSQAVATLDALLTGQKVIMVHFNAPGKIKLFREDGKVEPARTLACMGLADGSAAKDPLIWRCTNIAANERRGIWATRGK